MNIYRTEYEKKDIRLDVLMLGYASVGQEWCGDEVNSPFSFLYYIDDGDAVIETEYEEIRLLPGNWYLLPSGCRFRYSCAEKMSQYFFHIKLCGIDNLDLLSDCKKPLSLNNKSNFSTVINFIKDGKILESLGVKGLIYSILFEILNQNRVEIQKNKLSPCVKSAVEYINKNLSASLSTAKIAEHAFVSKSTLSKHFTKEMQLSVQQYLFDVIFDRACRLLLDNRKSIGQISSELGFCDQLYFSKKFKLRYGVSPREYRKRFF